MTRSEPSKPDELVELLDQLRAVFGPPDRMESPQIRALYHATESRLIAAVDASDRPSP